MPIPLISKRKEIVEAEFEEKPTRMPSKRRTIRKKEARELAKKPTTKTEYSETSKQKTAKKQSKKDDSNINLDDIAKMLGAK